ncbi:MAG: TolB-like 6-bladed beta-propeller domain-containing protein [Ignavibacteriaceae bacterium]|jgi:hypothetical protein|nr:TolB-like 6-bladed beta-propeller domain-containing protein [Ignavibacteriaceae bacterium]
MTTNLDIINLLFFFCIFYSCSTSKQDDADFTEESFKETIHLTDGRMYKNDSLFLGKPTRLSFHPDSFLIFSDEGASLVKIIDLKRNKIQEIIKQGKGPGEMIKAFEIEILNKDVYVLCPILGKMIKLTPDNNRKFQITDEFNLGEKGINRLFPLNKDLFVCLSKIGDEKRLTFLDNRGKVIRKLGDYPPLLNSKELKGDNNIFQSFISASPAGNKFVLVCSQTDVFEIYDIDKGLINRFQGPIGIQLMAKNENVGVGRGMHLEPRYLTYCMVAANEKEFWTGYVGYKSEKRKRPSISEISPKRIFCFDWKGNPLRKIEFDFTFLGLDVDWAGKVLYLLEWEHDNPEVVSYSLNEILK